MQSLAIANCGYESRFVCDEDWMGDQGCPYHFLILTRDLGSCRKMRRIIVLRYRFVRIVDQLLKEINWLKRPTYAHKLPQCGAVGA